MNTVFIGGSRHVSRLSNEARERLNTIIDKGFRIVVGDANGADKAVQKYLSDAGYKNVTVYCSGDSYRNNLGQWETHYVDTPKNLKGFQFYAAKDREMALAADFGLMIWDGKSAGTVLNVLRLIRAAKKAVLLNIPDNRTITFKTGSDWDQFISRCSADFRKDLRERATPEEWAPLEAQRQPSFLDTMNPASALQKNGAPPVKTEDELEADINAALAAGDPALVVDALGNIARARGMSQVAKDAGLARESLYRSLSSGGNPEFATVFKVMSSVGLRLTAHKVSEKAV